MIYTIKKRIYTISLIASSLLFSGCMTSSSVSEQQRPKQWGTQINRAYNFYQISSDVFRSEQPDHQLISELNTHQIGLVINLRHRDHDQKTFAGTSIQLIQIPIHTWAMNREDLLQVMQHIQRAKQNQQKVLIHCYHGSDRTGASIAMYRIIFEQWSTQDALNEMRHGGYGFHPIWINIDKIFKPENIKWIREQLSNPS